MTDLYFHRTYSPRDNDGRLAFLNNDDLERVLHLVRGYGGRRETRIPYEEKPREKIPYEIPKSDPNDLGSRSSKGLYSGQ